MSLRCAATCLALLLAAAAAAQPAAPPAPETLWVAPRQTLPLYTLPQLGAPTAATLATDDAVTVLGRQGEFVQVRTAAGAIGWARSAALTDVSPRPAVEQAAEAARLAQQVVALDAQVRAFQDENAQLRQRLAAVEGELAQRTRAVPLTPAGVFGALKRLAFEPSTWIAVAAFLAALLFAFRAGVAHRDESIRQRFGGLDL